MHIECTHPQIGQQEKDGRPPADGPPMAGGSVDSRKETEDILNSILPPRCWEEDGQLWTQTVSSVPATRQDVINLQEQLDTRLQQTQARETGICAVRRELYTQCFDELIRQVTINCTERGLLLLRIRDEIAMSMEAYETLYCSSVAFGLRKALQSQEGKETLLERVATLEVSRFGRGHGCDYIMSHACLHVRTDRQRYDGNDAVRHEGQGRADGTTQRRDPSLRRAQTQRGDCVPEENQRPAEGDF